MPAIGSAVPKCDAPVDVEDHRARRVRHVGHVGATAGELPHQPRVDRPAEQLARRGALLRPRDLIEDPADLRGGEVRVDDQPGALADLRRKAHPAQALADRLGDPALPHDGGVDRRSRRAFPYHRGLALIGDPDGRDVARGQARGGEGLAPDRDRGTEDLLGVVLDVARRGVGLRDLAVGAAPHACLVVEDDRGGAGRALIERQDRGHGVAVVKRRIGSSSFL